MEVPFIGTNVSSLKGCLVAIACVVASVLIVVTGSVLYGQLSPWVPALPTLLLLALSYWIGRRASKQATNELTVMKSRDEQLDKIAYKYNKNINDFKRDYNKEKSQVRGTASKEAVRKKYYEAYLLNEKSYEYERDLFLDVFGKQTGKSSLYRVWKRVISFGFIILLGACSFSTGLLLDPTEPADNMASLADERSWGYDNIPMPHLTNGDLYVVNPDSIISADTENRMNLTLSRLDRELGIESVVVIVGHVVDDDPMGMVRGIYEKYHVGREDRGLVIVVGYLDHNYFIAPGKALEADLTDAECGRLGRNYLVPGMRAEQPDSAMLYLVEGTYALMAQKDMPTMTQLSAPQGDSDDGFSMAIAFYLVVFFIWSFIGASIMSKYGWNRKYGRVRLIANPFLPVYTSSSFGSYSSGGGHSYSGGGGWSGGHSSGGFGGGSWGGGGAGGRW